MSGKPNLFENLWKLHTIEQLDDNNYLLAIDRCYLHDLSGPSALGMLTKADIQPIRNTAIFAISDHTLSSKPGRKVSDSPISAKLVPLFTEGCSKLGIRMFGLEDERQGIVHVTGPELGLSLPGMTIVCGDSHTCTHGALGALSWGVGSSELYHVLATQSLLIKRPKTMRIELTGIPGRTIEPMDIILYIIAQYGVNYGIGYAIEYTGEVIRHMEMEQRMTLCNLTVELGSEYGLISPDEKTLNYIHGREYSPISKNMQALKTHCSEIASVTDSVFDKTIKVDVSKIGRQVSWGITPAHTIQVSGTVPSSANSDSKIDPCSLEEAYSYMDLTAGQKIEGTQIQQVFIGSCSNGRISNIKQVAEMVEGKKVAKGVTAWVVPGSQQVKREAEALGLDKIIIDAGFVWGEPCCSLCGGCNGERVAKGHRCVSTTNRNFIGRQGPGARTHLASPYTAVMAALSGIIQ